MGTCHQWAISLSTNTTGTTVVAMGCCEVLVQADALNAGVVAVSGAEL